MKCFKNGKILFVLLAGLFFSFGPLTQNASAKISVFVSILPQKYFVDQIAKDLVKVEVMVPVGASPATYEPKPSQMIALSKAKAYFAIGVPFERAWLSRIASANSNMKIIPTQANIELKNMALREKAYEALLNSNNSEDHKAHGHTKGLDPHIWLAPSLVVIQAKNIKTALCDLDPKHKKAYEKNYSAFVGRVNLLNDRLAKSFSEIGSNNRLMVFHPAWGYFCDAYNLVQIPVEKEGKSPTPKGLIHLINQARSLGVKVIFAQPQFSTKSAETVAKAIDGKVVKIDPLAYDWEGNLFLVAKKIKSALK